jgi:two-component system, cell cycle response regulator
MRVVLVDPSRTVLKCLARTLDTQGHDVHPFTDSTEALQYIKLNHLVDALITSAQLSSMSGRELCLEVRRVASCRRPIYILLMSSSDEHRNLIDALDNGADDFISKPPITEELYARLRAANRIVSMQRELIRLAATDFLTGVLNRRTFFEKAQELCARAEIGGVLSTIMFDIDYFKRINDSYGHSAGDEALRAIAREVSKEGAIVGRLGGEEFAILLEGVPLSRAVEIAESLRLRLQELEVSIGEKKISLACSFGVSQWQADDTIDVLLGRADVALYKAKTDGRNRIVVGECMSDAAGYDRLKSAVRSGSRDLQKSVAA